MNDIGKQTNGVCFKYGKNQCGVGWGWWCFGWSGGRFRNKIGYHSWHSLPLVCINIFLYQNSLQDSFLESLTSLQGQLCCGKEPPFKTSENQMF